jgi:serine/threonine protein kinase
MVDIRFSKQIKHLENEFQLMSSLDHPNILKVVGLKHNIPIKGISDPTSDIRRDVLIMEFANEGSLLSVIKTGIQLNVKKNFII